MVDFRERLLDLIRSTGKTLNTVAKESGVSSSRLSDYCTKESKKGMASENLVLLADYFGCSTDYILGRTNVKSPEIDLQGVCQYTGLSEDSITNITKLEKYTTLILDLILSGYIDFVHNFLVDLYGVIRFKYASDEDIEFYSWRVSKDMYDFTMLLYSRQKVLADKSKKHHGKMSDQALDISTASNEELVKSLFGIDCLTPEEYAMLCKGDSETLKSLQQRKNADIRYFEQVEKGIKTND